jgi:hypothetical protein
VNELHAAADKLFTEVDHLDRILAGQDDPSEEQVSLALGVAKRVRRDCTILVRLLAAARDQQL